MIEHVIILVNEKDEEIGTMEKLEVHLRGLLHRAFSVFIFNSKGEMLLQQRAVNKYHSGGLWTNACCSHPKPGESNQQAAERRLKEEMGFITSVQKIFEFIYSSEFENGLKEFEFDHVFAGIYDGAMCPNADEVNDYCFKSIDSIKESLHSNPSQFTTWFHIAFPLVVKWTREQNMINKIIH